VHVVPRRATNATDNDARRVADGIDLFRVSPVVTNTPALPVYHRYPYSILGNREFGDFIFARYRSLSRDRRMLDNCHNLE